MTKKVFPMGSTTKTARQRADMMLGRGSGVHNEAPPPPMQQQQQQAAMSYLDDESQVTIQSR